MSIYNFKLKHNIDKDKIYSGVYFLFDDSGSVVYVGKSLNVHLRVMKHINECKKEFKTWNYIEAKELDLDVLEQACIKKESPKYNLTHNPEVLIERKDRVTHFFNESIKKLIENNKYNDLKIGNVKTIIRKILKLESSIPYPLTEKDIYDFLVNNYSKDGSY